VLGVDPALIAERGAVSEPVAEAMAAGALRQFGADVAIATTGIAGPGGGSAESRSARSVSPSRCPAPIR
jgi:nicotinamide-nucleotide amidase